MKYRIRQWIKMLVQHILLPFYYNLFRWRRVETDRVILADAHHKERPAKLQCYYDHLVAEGYDVLEIYEDYQNCSFFRLLKKMLGFMRHYATAGYVILCDNFLPAASCRKRKETKVIQVWHGCGALKKFGYDTVDDIPAYYKGNVFRNYSLVPVSGPEAVEPFSSAMRTDKECVQPMGAGYTDCYYDAAYLEKTRKRFFTCCPEAQGKKVVLWAPTFRGTAASPYVVGEEAVLKLGEELGEDYYVIMKLHPHMEAGEKTRCPMTADELVCVADVLITDYSSVIFLYAVFQKPLVLFVPDKDAYSRERGFYLEFDKLPGRIVTDGTQLGEAVLQEIKEFDQAAMKRFFEHHMGGCDGFATGRLIDWMKRQAQ